LISSRIHFSPVSANPERATEQWSGRRENNTSTSGVSFHKDQEVEERFSDFRKW
jgi:hypothetical protein